MVKRPKTYFELSLESDNHYYAVIYLPCGQDYYKGPYANRSKARRVAIYEQSNHDHATKSGMLYNVRIGD